MMIQAPIFELPKHKRQQKKHQQQPKQEPLPWEGEPEMPQPPFLPAA